MLSPHRAVSASAAVVRYVRVRVFNACYINTITTDDSEVAMAVTVAV